jgi:hypothetical protein
MFVEAPRPDFQNPMLASLADLFPISWLPLPDHFEYLILLMMAGDLGN